MLLKLRVTSGSNAGKEIIINKEKFLIGRADDCNLRPHSDAISRRHCVIINSSKGVGVRDLKSRNGTVVNGNKITGDKRLRNGDKLEVGPLHFEVILQKTAADIEHKKASGKPAPQGEPNAIGGMVSQWLEEADDAAQEEQRLGTPDTREYRFDETSQIEVDETAVQEVEKSKAEEAKRKAEEDEKSSHGKEKKEPGKLPKFEVKQDAPKDTQEAAQQVLRKLFNRS